MCCSIVMLWWLWGSFGFPPDWRSEILTLVTRSQRLLVWWSPNISADEHYVCICECRHSLYRESVDSYSIWLPWQHRMLTVALLSWEYFSIIYGVKITTGFIENIWSGLISALYLLYFRRKCFLLIKSRHATEVVSDLLEKRKEAEIWLHLSAVD